MKFELCYIGRPQQSYIEEGINLFSKRLSHYTKFELVRIDKIKNGHKLGKEGLLKKEAEVVQNRLSKQDYFVLLDEKGSLLSSKELASWVEKLNLSSHKRVIFQVGGVYGFHQDLYQRSHQQLSLSPMTLPHELAKLIFLEQLYRAFTIIRNESYHNP